MIKKKKGETKDKAKPKSGKKIYGIWARYNKPKKKCDGKKKTCKAKEKKRKGAKKRKG